LVALSLDLLQSESRRVMRMQIILKAIIGDDRGATAVEYGLILALIAMMLVTVLTELNGEVTDMYSYVDTTVSQNLGN